jgi:CMP-N-acetylneuraminic acid synthetase
MDKIIAVIPARKNSVRLPKKNTRKFCNHSLIDYAISIAQQCNLFDEIVVTTDDPEILSYSVNGIRFIKEPEIKEGNINKSLLFATKGYPDHTVVVLLQPTSPLRTVEDIEKAYYFYRKNRRLVIPVHFEDPYTLKLNGVVFVFDLKHLRKHGKVVSGTKINVCIIPKERGIDIDTIEEFEEAERLMGNER